MYYSLAKSDVSCVVFAHVLFRVIDGMDTLDAMEGVPTDAKDRPLKEIVIKSVTIHANPLA